MKIITDRDIPYIKGVLEPFAEVVYRDGRSISAADVHDADALVVRTRTRCDRRLLEGSAVRIIASATIGSDHIDMDYCARAGIDVAVAAGCNARGVLQWVGAAFVAASARDGWSPADRTLGIVGVGHVGSLVAEYARMWGFGEVLCCDPPRARAEGVPFAPLDEIAARCDIITFHVPLTHTGADATFHLADRTFFDKTRPGVLILNSARGEIIETAALADAAQNDVCTCAIDTWEHEPLIDRRLLRLSMFATPHIAGYSAQGKANAASMSVQALARKFGLPLTEWYPVSEVMPSMPRPISWDELHHTIGGYFDISAETAALKQHPADFELFRNSYAYRTEYF
ncbi:MAG: 4-phosphoerythronate dehydrogenase [Rikenellaceae bacterium]|nr:4-phosphoerythronate dehydrogenase [Rikenellaceae bacterium]MCL2692436.1 4-phosphoerythronate dehydrogenase [Rikenellaceae bacterium]